MSDLHFDKAMVLVIAGVSGSGKTTIGSAVARRLEWPFQEGDDLHDTQAIAKMQRGEPLDDADRMPWLERVAQWIDHRLEAGECGVITCSALKRSYRTLLQRGRDDILVVILHGEHSVVAERIQARRGHFMPASLLPSQYASYEPPMPPENAVQIDIAQPLQNCIDEVVSKVLDHLRELPPT